MAVPPSSLRLRPVPPPVPVVGPPVVVRRRLRSSEGDPKYDYHYEYRGRGCGDAWESTRCDMTLECCANCWFCGGAGVNILPFYPYAVGLVAFTFGLAVGLLGIVLFFLPDTAVCPCEHGLAVAMNQSSMFSSEGIHAFQCTLHETDCDYCHDGYELNWGRCELRRCECQNGEASVGTSCPKDGQEHCESCQDDYVLSNNGCRLKTCVCQNGVASPVSSCPSDGAEHCDSCDDGYHLSSGTCSLRACHCSRGVGSMGTLCPAQGKEHCKSCDEGSELNDNSCNLRTCACSHGTASRGTQCPKDGQEHCQECNEGFGTHNNLCIEERCALALEGVVPAPDSKGNAAAVPQCSNQSLFAGQACSIPHSCLQKLSDADPLRIAPAFVKGMAPFNLGISSNVMVSISAAVLAFPIVYALARQKPFMLVVEISVSAADFASDVLNTFLNDYYSSSFLYASLVITFGAGLLTILGQYGPDLIMLTASTYNRCAWLPLNMLLANGFHPIFAAHKDSAEKLILNLLATLVLAILAPVMILLVAPAMASLHFSAVFSLGVILHSIRLLLLREVHLGYESLFPATSAAKSPNTLRLGTRVSENTHVTPRKYHGIIFTEVMSEAGPSIGLTLVNYYYMRSSFMVQRLSWTAGLSLFLSMYLFLRVGYKYFYWLGYEQKPFDSIPLPYDVTIDYETLTKDAAIADAMAAGGAIASVGGAAEAAAVLMQ
ncbi:Uncharacterized protein SCF082_LOCUS26182 [Durusdinium trenchii]|uniref:EGF-like domain-containing protein n=1 Tax=Durusdinium trenchii TaxID=1381693 RepID=A0ABP0M4Y1_9DINO